MINEILNKWFGNSKIDEKDQIDYIILCDYFNEEKTFKRKHLKQLKKQFKKEKLKEVK